MRAILLGCVLIGAAGCVLFREPKTPEQIREEEYVAKHGPSGPQTTDCRRPSSCFEEAKTTCPHGYDIVNKTQDVLPGGGYIPPSMRTTLVYECRHPERER